MYKTTYKIQNNITLFNITSTTKQNDVLTWRHLVQIIASHFHLSFPTLSIKGTTTRHAAGHYGLPIPEGYVYSVLKIYRISTDY